MTEAEIDRLLTLSSLGDLDALHTLVDYFLETKDYRKAFLNAQKFEFRDDYNGYRKLGYLYENGLGTVKDIEAAKKCYYRAYELGDYLSAYNLALILQKEGKYAELIPLLALGKYNNHLPSIKLLAKLYYMGLGIEKNLDVALNLYQLAFELGDKTVIGKIGRIYYQKQDYYTAVKYLNKASQYGDDDAIYLLGVCYAKGLGVAMDLAKAVELYQIGASHNHPKCINNLAQHYLKGLGVEKDEQKAKELLEKL